MDTKTHTKLLPGLAPWLWKRFLAEGIAQLSVPRCLGSELKSQSLQSEHGEPAVCVFWGDEGGG